MNNTKKQVYIFGDPVEHSKSPAMHTAGYKMLDIEDQFEYLKKHVKPDDLKEAVEMLRNENIAGANITVPHKIAVMEYLDEIDGLAQKIGAVNTIVNNNGSLTGYNTDAPGYLKSLEYYNNFNPTGKKIAIFGAGGASKAIAFTLDQEKVQEISVGEIDIKKAADLTTKIETATAYLSNSTEFLDKVAKADLVINCTPLGMHPHKDKTPLTELSVISEKQLYSDIVYVPKDTLFLQNAQKAGAQIHYGFGMLLWQGIIAFEYFTSQKPTDETIKAMEKTLL